MEPRTKVIANYGQQDLLITREFDLPVGLLFTAFTEPEIIAQWMNTKVLKFEAKKHGNYEIETGDGKGNVAFRANGVIHDFVAETRIARTFEMEGMPFGVQLEIYSFEPLTNATSQLKMHVIYETVAQRDQVLKLSFAQGINMAHNRIQQLLEKK